MTLKQFDEYKINGAQKEDLKSIFFRENIIGFIFRIAIGVFLGAILGDMFGEKTMGYQAMFLGPFVIIGYSWLRNNIALFYEINMFNIILLFMGSFILGFILLPVQIIQSIMIWRKINLIED